VCGVWQRLVECIICILSHCKLLSENTIIEENRHWLVTSGFWTGCKVDVVAARVHLDF